MAIDRFHDDGHFRKSSMVIATAADDQYAMPMSVTLYSALANMEQGRPVSLYIIDGGISEQNRRRLAEVLRMKHLKVQTELITPNLARLNGLQSTKWFSQASYLRLLIPELMPDQVDRVIYLDSDFVVEKDLGELWEAEMGDFPALAVQESGCPYVSCPLALPETYQLLGLKPDTPYCNSGVMVMNVRRWRTEEIGRRALEYVHKFHQFVRWADQDGLNAVIAGAWGLLNPKWNANLSAIKEGDLLRAPFILHFAGPSKPWHFLYRGPCRSRFFYYLQNSGWLGSMEDTGSVMKEAWEEQNRYDKWMERSYETWRDLLALIPPQASFILVDDGKWAPELFEDRHVIPFLERDGQYWGSPPDSQIAIRELERLRGSGANYIVFDFPAFWWLEHYSELHHHLRSKFRCVLTNSVLVLFDLQ